jgi:hypothetical protein
VLAYRLAQRMLFLKRKLYSKMSGAGVLSSKIAGSARVYSYNMRLIKKLSNDKSDSSLIALEISLLSC